MQEIPLRNVGPKQIYDSYMGILRISPSMLEGEIIDSMSIALINPYENESTPRKIVLSDSDGISLGLYFTGKIRRTRVHNEKGAIVDTNLVNIISNTDSNVFVTRDFHIRCTLILNKANQTDRISPVQIYMPSDFYVDVYDVITYPIDSPHDDSYFNNENRLGLIDYNNSKSPYEQLKTSLRKKSKEWYDANIDGSHRVQVAGKFIYTENENHEEIPIVYTKEYILGQYNGHTARLTDEVRSKYLGSSIGPEKTANGSSLLTKLSFIRLDKFVWEILGEAAQGYIRHSAGRYTHLGPGCNHSISERLFGTINPPTNKAPLLGTGVTPGIILYSAIPFRRYMFHVLRQELRNAIDENNGLANLDPIIRAAYEAGKLTPINKRDPGFMNGIAKEYVLCNGYELNYTNYPNINTDNTLLFSHDEKGNVLRGGDGRPNMSINRNGVYGAMMDSNGGKLQVPSLLVTEQVSPRYLRGLNWLPSIGVDSPIDFDMTEILQGTYKDNDKEFEVVKDSDYGLTPKNFSSPQAYRFGIDWKTNTTHHKHYCFTTTETWNREDKLGNLTPGTNIITNTYHTFHLHRPWRPSVTKVVASKYTPYYWNITTEEEMSDASSLIDYSFLKHKGHNPNSWDYHTPLPCAGTFAWKITDEGMTEMNEEKVQAGQYEAENPNQTPIEFDKEKRANQLEMLNYAEGAIPIATKGGTNKHKGPYQFIYCVKRKKTGRHNRLRASCQYTTGGYTIQKVAEVTKEGEAPDIPRCVTSLPISSIMDKITTPEDPLEVQMGDTTIQPDNSLGIPPSTILLPLFKV